FLLLRRGPRPRRFRSKGMKTRLITILAIVVCCTLGGVALALDPHTGGIKGQPSQNPLSSCEVSTMHPGNAASAPGSAFKDGGVAGTKYAGEQSQNSKNPKSVSQYDVACFQQTNRALQQSARMSQRTATMSVGHGHGR